MGEFTYAREWTDSRTRDGDGRITRGAGRGPTWRLGTWRVRGVLDLTRKGSFYLGREGIRSPRRKGNSWTMAITPRNIREQQEVSARVLEKMIVVLTAA